MYCHTTYQLEQIRKSMKTTPVTPQDFTRSVVAVPPLCMRPDGMPCAVENRRLIEFLSAAGIATFVYGGNANLFHLSCSEFAATLEQAVAAVPEEAWLLPSIGPDFGKARDQIAILRAHRFPAAMLLPGSSPSTFSGVADGVRRLADALGAPLVLYLKSETYIAVDSLQALMREGKVCGVKYAVPRSDPSVDDYLKRLVESCGAENLISGFGERPAVAHCRSFGIKAFTSGLVCIAPHLSFRLLGALARGRRPNENKVPGKVAHGETAVSPPREFIDHCLFPAVAEGFQLKYSTLDGIGPSGASSPVQISALINSQPGRAKESARQIGGWPLGVCGVTIPLADHAVCIGAVCK